MLTRFVKITIMALMLDMDLWVYWYFCSSFFWPIFFTGKSCHKVPLKNPVSYFKIILFIIFFYRKRKVFVKESKSSGHAEDIELNTIKTGFLLVLISERVWLENYLECNIVFENTLFFYQCNRDEGYICLFVCSAV